MTASTRSGTGLGRWTTALARWETLLVARAPGLIVLGNALSPFFLTAGNFSNLLAALMEVAIMALPMTLIIILGEIDLSVESMAGLVERRPRLPVGGGRAAPGRDPDRPASWAPSAASSTACSSPAAACRRSSSRWARSPCSGAWP